MKGCLTIGVSYERDTAKSKAFVQEKFVLEPDSVYIRGVSLEGLGTMCLLGLKFFCKWADISDSEDCIFQRISSSPGNFHLDSFLLSSFRSSSVSKPERTSFPLHPSPVRTDH